MKQARMTNAVFPPTCESPIARRDAICVRHSLAAPGISDPSTRLLDTSLTASDLPISPSHIASRVAHREAASCPVTGDPLPDHGHPATQLSMEAKPHIIT